MMNEGMYSGGIVWMLLLGLILVVPFWRICTKAGFAGPLSLLILIPLVNVGLLYFLAFASWPTGKSQSSD